MSRRTERVNDLLQEELSGLIQRDLNDPRLANGLVTVTEVTVSPDLRHATVFVSYMGKDEGEREGALAALKSSAPHLHRELVRRLAMRNVPALAFRFDPSIERGARLAELLLKVKADEGEAEAATDGDGHPAP